MRRERLGPIKRHASAARRRTPTASRERGRGRTNRVAARAAAPGVNQKLQVLRAAWLPFGDRLLRRLLALLGGLVACVQLHRSAWPQVGRALRCALGSGGWDCRAWEAGDGRQRVGKSVGRVAARAGTAGRCRASVRASVQPLTSHLGLNKRLSRLLLRSRRTGRQHLHSRARDAARLTRLRRQWRQKAGAGRGQAEHTGTPHQHAEQQGKVAVQRTLACIIGVWLVFVSHASCRPVRPNSVDARGAHANLRRVLPGAAAQTIFACALPGARWLARSDAGAARGATRPPRLAPPSSPTSPPVVGNLIARGAAPDRPTLPCLSTPAR